VTVHNTYLTRPYKVCRWKPALKILLCDKWESAEHVKINEILSSSYLFFLSSHMEETKLGEVIICAVNFVLCFCGKGWKRENKKWCWIVAAGCHLSIRLSYSSGDKGGSYWGMEKDGNGKP